MAAIWVAFRKLECVKWLCASNFAVALRCLDNGRSFNYFARTLDSQGCGLVTGQVNFVRFKGGGWGIIAQFTLASILLAYMLLIWRPGWQSKTKSNCILHHSLWQPDIYLRWENDVITSSVFQKWLLLTRCRVRNWRLTLAWQARHYKLVVFIERNHRHQPRDISITSGHYCSSAASKHPLPLGRQFRINFKTERLFLEKDNRLIYLAMKAMSDS